MKNRKNNRENRTEFKLILCGIVFLTVLVPLIGVMAVTPLNPVNPYEIKNGTIDYGDKLNLYYDLEEDKKYHIFLVGDWVENNATSRTDYDIYTYAPSSYNVPVTIHTEAAGLPEQVANDKKHQYFVPKESGRFKFEILNDPEDSKGTRSAFFMVIEHLNLNTIYPKELFGRLRPGQDYNPELNSWGYEFDTNAQTFEIFVEVPDTLDMYELRLYPMAKLDETGFNVAGIAVPPGSYLNASTYAGGTGWGGYNTVVDGYRNVIASGEYNGDDIRIIVNRDALFPDDNTTELQKTEDETLEGEENNPSTFYFIALLAEYQQGEVEFYIKTDFWAPNVTLVDPPEVGFTESNTEILADLEDFSAIKEVWVNYTSDNWETEEKAMMSPNNELYKGYIPAQELFDKIKYKVYAKDAVDNIGETEGVFDIWEETRITFGISQTTLLSGEPLTITGGISLGQVRVSLNISHEYFFEVIPLVADNIGSYMYKYNAPMEGTYRIYAFHDGDDTHYPARSIEKVFDIVKRTLEIECRIDKSPAKNQMPLTISGRINPPAGGINIDLIMVTPEGSRVETVVTNMDGSYSTTIIPDEVGYWELLPQNKPDTLFLTSQGEFLQFEVAKLTIVDLAYLKLMLLLIPPYSYFAIGLFGVGLVGIEMKFNIVSGLIKSIRKKDEEDTDIEDAVLTRDSTTKYKRRSKR